MTNHLAPLVGRKLARAAISRRTLIAAAGSLTPLTSRPAHAEWPDRPIRLIVAYPPGGGTDIMARAVAQKLGEVLKQSIVVENRSGANGTVGTLAVAQSRPDGYTLLFANGGEFALKPLMELGLPYDTSRDFDLVAMCGSTPVVLAVNARVPAQTLNEFIELARRQPGRINVSNSGSRGTMHLAAAYLAQRAAVELTHVPYRGAAPAVADTVSGTVQAVAMGLPPVLAQARDGRLRILGIMSARRNVNIPDVPTFEELGFPGFDLSNSVGIAGPRGLPTDVVVQLNAAVNTAMQDPEIRRIFIDNGAEPVSMSVEDYRNFLLSEMARMREVVRIAGVPPE
ncbi:tripartite tricarboxylate transporter substrate binding protein [Roseomonas terrae]|uniref:Tripartite tricarboxylate transporter substrate binding protein n=1 Tax=Neoroseomonas terrae TaxID=424799 RepID=A0ABS5EC82_9PROT|nr:tripartite tricarboxylate transporter substrate binding protein [Neoroseomonas terrae]MBR0648637.1 tripartite tricarboxylate transporter substrate binding protein [Neoroseomonas terrae]